MRVELENEFVSAAEELRRAQKQFFFNKNSDKLMQAIIAEKKFDKILRTVKAERSGAGHQTSLLLAKGETSIGS